MWWARPDLNGEPSGYKPDALTIAPRALIVDLAISTDKASRTGRCLHYDFTGRGFEPLLFGTMDPSRCFATFTNTMGP
jgi:hypothetical protein